MGSTIQSLAATARAVVTLALLGVVTLGGWTIYRYYYEREVAVRERDELRRTLAQKDEQLDALQQQVSRLRDELQRKETALRLLKVDTRVAHLAITRQWHRDDGRLMTQGYFLEVDQQGRPLGRPVHFTIEGDEIHINAFVAKFEDEYVEQGVPLKNTSICLFRRIYGEFQSPSEGIELDPVGRQPRAYSDGLPPTQFERELWANFWDYANSAEKRKAVGLRAAEGQGPYKRVRAGKLYPIQLRASDGLGFGPEQDLPAEGPPA